MSRSRKPNTAEVTLRFRVPKGFSAAAARRLILNNPAGHYGKIDVDGADGPFGFADEVTVRVGPARIIRAKVESRS